MKSKKHNYRQGIFRPKNPKKYKGVTPIIFRSSLELKFCRWCDNSSFILEWGSESVVVPYKSPKDGKIHRYFIDNNIKFKDKKGNINKYLIEIKPYRQTLPPKKTPRKKQKTILYETVMYAVNKAKWLSATKWAEKNGYKFLILTEKDIF